MLFQRIFLFSVLFLSCDTKTVKLPELSMTDDQIISAMVNMYAANATLNINDPSFRDSTSEIYYKQVSNIAGLPIEVIRSDFEKLLMIPDTLLILQNRALDTLRMLQEKQLGSQKISIGIN